MAVIKIEAKKDTRCTQTICLIQGDRRTQILRFGVNRFDGGVDLSDLVWVIKTVNANGVEDVFGPAAVEIGENRITIDWLVEGSVTDADGLAKYELNGLDAVGEEPYPVIWRGGTGTINLRASISPKFGESDGMTNIEKLILYVDGELQNVIDAGSAAADAAARANRAADNVEDLSGAVERANTAAQRATDAATAVEDLEGAVTRANSAAALATDGAMSANAAASMAYSAATRATEAAKNVENIEEATVAAYDAADDARMAAEIANTAGLPAAMIYGRRVMGETAKAAGNPVSFLPDAGSLLQPVTVLEPQQEGSGEPYPAGGGRNMIPNIISAHTHYGITFTPNDDGSITVNGTNTNADAAATCILGNIDFEGGKTYSISGVTGYEANTLQIWVQSTNAFPPGSRLQSFDGAVTRMAAASESCEVRVQVGSGVTLNNVKIYPMLAEGTDATYAPYENIRPFIGYDKLNLNHAGKNIYNPSEAISKGNFEHHGVTGTWRDDGDLILNGTLTSNAWQSIGTSHMMSGKTYTVSVSGNVMVTVWDRVADVFVGNATLGTPFTFTAASTGTYAYAIASVTGASFADERVMLMVAEGSVATGWQPYQGTLHTVQIGQTVYGGRFGWLTGKLVAEWVLAKGVFTRATLDSSGKLYAVTGIPSTAKPYPTTQEGLYEPYIVCTALLFKTLEAARRHGKPCITQYGTEIYIGGYIGKEAELDALLASDDFAVAYKLATPIEIQLTPHILTAVEPEQTNTLYGDGSIEVEYVKPLHVSIEERVAAALAAAAE